MLNSKTGTKLDTFVSDYVVFDLETTGISPYSDKVVEISAVTYYHGFRAANPRESGRRNICQ